MTKKSSARQFRDQQAAEQSKNLKKEGRNGWDEVMNLSNGVLACMVVEVALKDPLKNKVLMSHLTNAEGLDCAMKVRLLEQDLLAMLEKFKGIRARHEGKSGREVDYNEVMTGYEIVMDYERLQQEYDAFIIPTKSDIIQYINNAEHRMQQREQAAKAAAQATTETTE